MRQNVFRSHRELTAPVFLLIIIFWVIQASAEEWSETQMEVWKTVEITWEHIKQGEVEKLMRLERTVENLEWWGGQAVPLDEKTIEQLYMSWLAYNQPRSYELRPIKIQIIGNVANVFYQWKWEGDAISENGRQMSTYIKQENTWKFMGSMGCACDKPPFCLE